MECVELVSWLGTSWMATNERDEARLGSVVDKKIRARVGKEDEHFDKKAVGPPVDNGRSPPADRVAVRLDGQEPCSSQAAARNAAQKRQNSSSNHVTRLLLTHLSSETSCSNPRSTGPSTCPNRRQQRQWWRAGIGPESNRRPPWPEESGRRESKFPLDLLPLLLPRLIARANTMARSILGRNTGSRARRYTATAAVAAAQPQ